MAVSAPQAGGCVTSHSQNRRFVLDQGLPETEVIWNETVLLQLFPKFPVNLRAAQYFAVLFGNVRLFGKIIRLLWYRLPVRTLNWHCVLAPVLWNLNSVTSSDFGGIAQTWLIRYKLFDFFSDLLLLMCTLCCSDKNDQMGRLTVAFILADRAYLWPQGVLDESSSNFGGCSLGF